ncbi:hypothetical protein C3Z14_14180 [Proteus mirabilis]|uniref:hypothetical protein n=1 Tax=Proteus mirabilis TaxID=584 RepID=UPI000CE05D7F|nr:hypothetical protein [Proteus mirabilis]AVA41091.1 hypothetical protein C3Z14_14180 [Proteus mirabilis]EJD6391810.1 hypothetical protein [Proteus mirabilis]MBI6260648.1 hypothetical protein [Proteus mirabilis]QQZ22455.1 hypothetical protein F7R84_14295 [Proteus mirabilis]QQZ26181.1 hypothetical protein F7R85_14295 [Proteus mirabilis]
MATITFLPAKDNLKMRRYKRNGEYYKQRNELKAKQKSRSVEEIWDSIIKPVDETDVLASLVLSLKSAPDTRKTLKLKNKPSSEFGVTAR